MFSRITHKTFLTPFITKIQNFCSKQKLVWWINATEELKIVPSPDPFSIYMYMSLRFYYFILINLPGKTYQYAYAKPNEICITLKLFKMCHSSDSYARSVIRASAATVRRHSRIKSWKPLTVNELRRFLAIVFNMGLIKKTSIEEYWNTTMPSQSSKWF